MQLFSVVSPDVMVRTCGMVQCHIVYPYSRPDLKIRIHHWLFSRRHTTTGSFVCIICYVISNKVSIGEGDVSSSFHHITCGGLLND